MTHPAHPLLTAPAPAGLSTGPGRGLQRRHLLAAGPAALLAVGLPGCASLGGSASTEPDAALRAVLAAPHRSEANRARDVWRNPGPTLAFFGIRPTLTVVELSPGGAWYSEILAPYLRTSGKLYLAHFPADSANANMRRSRANFAERMAKAPELYDKAVLATLPTATGAPEVPAGSADLVLTFRNVHNWVSDKSLDDKLRGCFAMLKPGGVLGVVDHRANPGTTLEAMAKSGYVTEAFMEERARAAGFVLAAKSEINANPKDTKDHPNGVWTLPPTFARKEVERERYAAIGESDRFTHRYVKPA
ncbi:class I SAM-dependent methyltransferase [Rubrivivax rivuli]|uniref:class I SAM-dependent methyltransferase n=1 Tax=Rubrivivax rivuli TaxID=1862385 RepID=UPI001FE22296|nr:methyltransferase [Rubrivivax rivuli]